MLIKFDYSYYYVESPTNLKSKISNKNNGGWVVWFDLYFTLSELVEMTTHQFKTLSLLF